MSISADQMETGLSTLAEKPTISFTPIDSSVTSHGDALDTALSQIDVYKRQGFVFVGENNLIFRFVDFYFTKFFVLSHLDKRAVIRFHDLALCHKRRDNHVE